MPSQFASKHFTESRAVVEASMKELSAPIESAASALVSSLRAGGKLICFGNGGSATQASHMAGELIGRFKANRRALPAIALSSDPGAVTCIANDFGYEALFERQISALANKADIALGLSTSGKSENVLRGLAEAKKRGAITIALCGEKGLARGSADHVLAVPSGSTAQIQEVHLMILHILCIAVEAEFPAE
jgi:D-sedoheptulose 7-phosphate isomerase